MALLHRSGTVVNRTVEYRNSRSDRLWGYAAKVYWHKVLGLSCSAEKGATAPFSCLPARTGPGSARKWVKGLVPCRFLELISAIFKVHLSLFLTHFFIGYLTLPCYAAAAMLQTLLFGMGHHVASGVEFCLIIQQCNTFRQRITACLKQRICIFLHNFC